MAAATGSDRPDFTFLQISDSHIGFSKDPNKDVTATLQETVARINQLPQPPDFVIHTGDLSHLSKASEFDTADQVRGMHIEKARALLAEIAARLLSAETRTPFDLQVLSRHRELAEQELADLERQERNLIIRSPAACAFIAPFSSAWRICSGLIRLNISRFGACELAPASWQVAQ